MTLGAICLDIGILFFVPMAWAEEPPLIYTMSAGALVYTGLAFIAAGQSLLETEKRG